MVLSSEADPTTAAVLREMLAAQLDTGARLVTVDASGLSFLDSASVRVLVLAARALQGRHGRLVLARPHIIATCRDGPVSGATVVAVIGTLVAVLAAAGTITLTINFLRAAF